MEARVGGWGRAGTKEYWHAANMHDPAQLPPPAAILSHPQAVQSVLLDSKSRRRRRHPARMFHHSRAPLHSCKVTTSRRAIACGWCGGPFKCCPPAPIPCIAMAAAPSTPASDPATPAPTALLRGGAICHERIAMCSLTRLMNRSPASATPPVSTTRGALASRLRLIHPTAMALQNSSTSACARCSPHVALSKIVWQSTTLPCRLPAPYCATSAVAEAYCCQQPRWPHAQSRAPLLASMMWWPPSVWRTVPSTATRATPTPVPSVTTAAPSRTPAAAPTHASAAAAASASLTRRVGSPVTSESMRARGTSFHPGKLEAALTIPSSIRPGAARPTACTAPHPHPAAERASPHARSSRSTTPAGVQSVSRRRTLPRAHPSRVTTAA
eukprot:scaffold6743_cov118-Isochrysis_galbana.AAC.1